MSKNFSIRDFKGKAFIEIKYKQKKNSNRNDEQYINARDTIKGHEVDSLRMKNFRFVGVKDAEASNAIIWRGSESKHRWILRVLCLALVTEAGERKLLWPNAIFQLKAAYVDRFTILRHKNEVEWWKTYKNFPFLVFTLRHRPRSLLTSGQMRKLDEGENNWNVRIVIKKNLTNRKAINNFIGFSHWAF